MGTSRRPLVAASVPVSEPVESPDSAGSPSKRLRSKGRGGIFLVRDGVSRVEVGRDS